jgi:RNA polymerase sigma factor (sigma-70 family)
MLNQPLETTVALLDRARNGDTDARDALMERNIPPLRRWTSGRLPHWARGLVDTQDLVQDAVLRTLPRLSTFEALHSGALQAFLRQAVANHIIDEIRKAKRRPVQSELPESQPDSAPSPLEQAIGREGFTRYKAALETLKPADQRAIIARVELQHSYAEVALAIGKPTGSAARMTVTRALVRLLEAMSNEARRKAERGTGDASHTGGHPPSR